MNVPQVNFKGFDARPYRKTTQSDVLKSKKKVTGGIQNLFKMFLLIV